MPLKSEESAKGDPEQKPSRRNESITSINSGFQSGRIRDDRDASVPPSESSNFRGVDQKLWKELGAKSHKKYKEDLMIGWWLAFRNHNLENEYAAYVRESYRFRNTFAGVFVSLIIIVVWALFSALMWNKTLYITRRKWAILYDVLHAIALACSLLLAFGNSYGFIRRHPEGWFYILTFPLYCFWICWVILVLSDSIINRIEVFGGLDIMTAMQYKFWTDTTLLVILFLLCTLYDQLMNTRTKFVIWLHSLAAVLYLVSRLLLIFSYVDMYTQEIVPSVVIIEIIQILVGAGLVMQAYLGRLQKELVERIAYLDIHDDHMRLRELREAQKKRKKGKGESVIEDLIHTIRKAQTSLQAAAFERSAQGDANLLELDEVLRQCVEILLDTDDLFAVGTTGDVKEAEEDEENQFIDMFQTGKKVQKAGEKTVASTKKTGEDYIRIVFEQQEFFTPDIMPAFAFDPELEEEIGKKSSLKLLAKYKTNPNILVECGYALLKPHFDFLSVSDTVIQKYLYQIQRRYYPNPYHNACHGAVVAHMAICIARLLDMESKVGEVDMVSLVIGGLGHDVGHPGRNNNFFLNQCQTMARMYNDNAILECYHSFLTFRYAVIGEEVNIFQGLSTSVYRALRTMIIENILVTDMSQHFASISKFRVRRASEKFDFKRNVEDAQMILRLCMKMADLSHALVDWQQHMDWSLRVTEEFYQQGEQEKSLGMPISPLCDRGTHKEFAKSQTGFLQFVVIPLANELGEVDETGLFSGELVTKLLFNKHKWEMLKEKGDLIDMPKDVLALKTAPPFYADSMLLQALRAKTVDEINADPLSVASVQEVIGKTEARKEALMIQRRSQSREGSEPESSSEEEENDEEDEEEYDDADEEEDFAPASPKATASPAALASPSAPASPASATSQAASPAASPPNENKRNLNLSGLMEDEWEVDDAGVLSPRGGDESDLLEVRMVSPRHKQR